MSAASMQVPEVFADADAPSAAWRTQIDPGRYDRRLVLSAAEREALADLGLDALRRRRGHDRHAPAWGVVGRLLRPLDEALGALLVAETAGARRARADAAALVLARCAERGSAFWGWSAEDWVGLIGRSAAQFKAVKPATVQDGTRAFLATAAYLLGCFTDFHRIGAFNRVLMAQRVFGVQPVQDAMREISAVLGSWGYSGRFGRAQTMPAVFAQALLLNRSPRLAGLTTDAFDQLRAHPAMSGWHLESLFAIQRAVAALGHCRAPVRAGHDGLPGIQGTDPAWAAWVERWHATSTVTPKVRAIIRSIMAKAGRWLAAEHPQISDPGQWTRQTCAAWVAAVDRMVVGDYVQRRDALGIRAGQPILPRTKAHILMASRTFFRDCQEWEWIGRRFDPSRALATPRSVHALIATNPRVIADDVWAKLLWAGLNLAPAGLPANTAGSYYPMELIRAITLTWLFSGQRSDEIARLRVGCIRWQHNGFPIPGDSREVLAQDAVCLLDVPTHKTGAAFSKPVDPLLGQAVEAWQAIRPRQPARTDPKTGERVDLLLAIRAHPVAKSYINRTVIPALCRKAGVPDTDVRGKITSHRARSTIASQLYNAKEPMTLFELQAWLGHGSPVTTQHYAKITPNTLARAYSDAGYFARNVRSIEVLLDRDAITSGAAAAGQPWQHYDLGHGWCSYSFFEQCPHRMACARCDFYTPKGSAQAQLLEAKTNLARMLTTIPLTDDERAAVDDDQSALDQLLARLAEVPTPAGPTPRDIGGTPTVTLLPIVEVRQGHTPR